MNTDEIHFLLLGSGEVAYIAELSFSFPFQFNSFKSLTGKSLLALWQFPYVQLLSDWPHTTIC